MAQPDVAQMDLKQLKAMKAPFELTALAISGSMVAIATTNWTGRSVRLVPSASTFFEVASHGRIDLLKGIAEIDEFIELNDIGKLVFRQGNFNGKENAGRIHIRFGTAIELVYDPIVVTTHKVSGWVNKKDWLLPEPSSSLTQIEKRAQRRAIETASFATWCILDARRTANG